MRFRTFTRTTALILIDARVCLTVVAAMLTVLCGGCGSSKSNNLSQAQAEAVTQEFSQALATALSSSGLPADARPASGVHPSLSTAVTEIRSYALPVCPSNGTGETCDFPVNFDGTCPGGGTIAVAGNVDGTLDNSGDGSIQSQITITPTNCSVDNLVINGDPSITVDGAFNFTANAPAFPITLTETGGISYGPNPSGSCQLNVTYKVSSQTSCAITGTVCGQAVNGSCSSQVP
jgi:hypothetical protein